MRELENVIERAVILGESSQVTAKLLGMEAAGVRRSRDQYHVDIAPDSMSLKDYFRHFVLRHQAELTEKEAFRQARNLRSRNALDYQL